MTTEIQLPPEFEDAVRSTAATAPAPTFDRADVYSRARRIRRRTAAARAIAAGVVVLAAAASYPFVHARLAPEVADGGLVGAQAIPLWADRPHPPTITNWGGAEDATIGATGEIAAQLRTVGGRNVMVRVREDQPGLPLGAFQGPVPLPGGGIAATGGSAGGEVVVVLDAAGRTVASRGLPHRPDLFAPRVMPLTGNSTTLFWWGFQNEKNPHVVLNRYDIRSGQWTVLTPTVGQDGFQLPYFGIQANASQIISWPAVGGRTCSADIEDARTGERVGVLRPVVSKCTDVHFALSPDGRKAAALVSYRTVKDWSQRVLIMDVGSGRVLKEVATPGLPEGTNRSELASGIDWLGNDSVRYARASFLGSDPAHTPVLLRIRP